MSRVGGSKVLKEGVIEAKRKGLRVATPFMSFLFEISRKRRTVRL